jgi:hypothetical protein
MGSGSGAHTPPIAIKLRQGWGTRLAQYDKQSDAGFGATCLGGGGGEGFGEASVGGGEASFCGGA